MQYLTPRLTGAVWAQESDPRMTGTGRLLRRTRLDEIPQLINVLRGEMSIVGPRPERPEFLNSARGASIPFWSRRHLLKPGITGWVNSESDMRPTQRRPRRSFRTTSGPAAPQHDGGRLHLRADNLVTVARGRPLAGPSVGVLSASRLVTETRRHRRCSAGSRRTSDDRPAAAVPPILDLEASTASSRRRRSAASRGKCSRRRAR